MVYAVLIAAISLGVGGSALKTSCGAVCHLASIRPQFCATSAYGKKRFASQTMRSSQGLGGLSLLVPLWSGPIPSTLLAGVRQPVPPRFGRRVRRLLHVDAHGSASWGRVVHRQNWFVQPGGWAQLRFNSDLGCCLVVRSASTSWPYGQRATPVGRH
jgi:hypothetical protein